MLGTRGITNYSDGMTFTYLQAAITGLIQGITELFPVSSLGHAVLVPAWIGGSWKSFTTDANSPYLMVTIALHAASALALFLVFRKRWIALFGGAIASLKGKPTVQSNLFWRLVFASIPVAIIGLVLDKKLRILFAKPVAASAFLLINGLILIVAEMQSRKASVIGNPTDTNREIVEKLSYPAAVTVGLGQSLALFAGISRFGASMSAGLFKKLSHPAASDFSFLLALPVIAGAALYKLPKLLGHEYSSLRGPIVVGSLFSFIATYISVSFLVRWFKTRTLYPFAIYCLIVGVASLIRFA